MATFLKRIPFPSFSRTKPATPDTPKQSQVDAINGGKDNPTGSQDQEVSKLGTIEQIEHRILDQGSSVAEAGVEERHPSKTHITSVPVQPLPLPPGSSLPESVPILAAPSSEFERVKELLNERMTILAGFHDALWQKDEVCETDMKDLQHLQLQIAELESRMMELATSPSSRAGSEPPEGIGRESDGYKHKTIVSINRTPSESDPLTITDFDNIRSGVSETESQSDDAESKEVEKLPFSVSVESSCQDTDGQKDQEDELDKRTRVGVEDSPHPETVLDQGRDDEEKSIPVTETVTDESQGFRLTKDLEEMESVGVEAGTPNRDVVPEVSDVVVDDETSQKYEDLSQNFGQGESVKLSGTGDSAENIRGTTEIDKNPSVINESLSCGRTQLNTDVVVVDDVASEVEETEDSEDESEKEESMNKTTNTNSESGTEIENGDITSGIEEDIMFTSESEHVENNSESQFLSDSETCNSQPHKFDGDSGDSVDPDSCNDPEMIKTENHEVQNRHQTVEKSDKNGNTNEDNNLERTSNKVEEVTRLLKTINDDPISEEVTDPHSHSSRISEVSANISHVRDQLDDQMEVLKGFHDALWQCDDVDEGSMKELQTLQIKIADLETELEKLLSQQQALQIISVQPPNQKFEDTELHETEHGLRIRHESINESLGEEVSAVHPEQFNVPGTDDDSRIQCNIQNQEVNDEEPVSEPSFKPGQHLDLFLPKFQTVKQEIEPSDGPSDSLRDSSLKIDATADSELSQDILFEEEDHRHETIRNTVVESDVMMEEEHKIESTEIGEVVTRSHPESSETKQFSPRALKYASTSDQLQEELPRNDDLHVESVSSAGHQRSSEEGDSSSESRKDKLKGKMIEPKSHQDPSDRTESQSHSRVDISETVSHRSNKRRIFPKQRTSSTSTNIKDEMFQAVSEGNVKRLSRLIEQKGNVSVFDAKGGTLAHEAATVGAVESLELILKHDRTLLWVRDDMGETLLHRAASAGQIQVFQAGLGVPTADWDDVMSLQDEEGNTPLHRAAALGHLEVVKTICEMGKGNVFATNGTGDSPAHCAARNAKIAVLEYLHGSDPVISCHFDHYGRSPRVLLHQTMASAFIDAARSGDKAKVHRILKFNLDDDLEKSPSPAEKKSERLEKISPNSSRGRSRRDRERSDTVGRKLIFRST